MKPKLSDLLRKNILLHLGDRTQLWLSKEAKINQGSLSQFLKGSGNPTIETIESICNALKIDPVILLGGYDGKSYDIPNDILKLLDDQSPAVYESIRTILKTIASEKRKK